MMKKNFPKILAGCTAMVLMTGALLVPSMAVNASAHQAVPHLQQASYIGEAKAKEIALNHAGVDASKVSWIFAKQDYDHGRMEYDVEFLFGNKEYDYKIDASTGTILGFDYDIEWHMTGSDTVSQSSTDIGAEKAKSIALKHAGLAPRILRLSMPTWTMRTASGCMMWSFSPAIRSMTTRSMPPPGIS